MLYQFTSLSSLLPKVRNSLEQKKKKKKKKPPKEKPVNNITPTKKKIRGYDYKAWDKFDVDKACDDVDNAEGSSPSEYETDEEWEDERKRLLAVQCKDQGNAFFKEDRYVEAIEKYTKGIEYDPTSAVLPANRAMALLKQERYAAAELDCSQALSIDESYLKAYHRRGTARAALNKYSEAKQDFEKVLKQEPKNRQARQELDKIERLLNPPKVLETKSIESSDVGIVTAVYKLLEKRSKKPLHRIEIEEIGEDEETIRRKQQMSSAQLKQSALKQRITAQDAEQFDKLLSNEKRSHNNVHDNGTGDHLKHSTISSPADIMLNITTSSEPIQNGGGGVHDMDNSQTTGDSAPPLLNSSTITQPVVPSTSSNNGVHAAISSTPVSIKLPPAPSTSYQFQTDYKMLKNSTELFYQYFKQIKPSLLPRLFGQSLDSDVLVNIFNILNDCYIPNDDDVYPPLLYLCDVSRFSMTIMFMSSQEKEVLSTLMEHLVSKSDYTEKLLAKLKNRYQIS